VWYAVGWTSTWFRAEVAPGAERSQVHWLKTLVLSEHDACKAVLDTCKAKRIPERDYDHVAIDVKTTLQDIPDQGIQKSIQVL